MSIGSGAMDDGAVSKKEEENHKRADAVRVVTVVSDIYIYIYEQHKTGNINT
jgi:hypothetical protein